MVGLMIWGELTFKIGRLVLQYWSSCLGPIFTGASCPEASCLWPEFPDSITYPYTPCFSCHHIYHVPNITVIRQRHIEILYIINTIFIDHLRERNFHSRIFGSLDKLMGVENGACQ